MQNETELTSALTGKRRALMELQLRRRRAESAGGGVVPVGRDGLLPLSWQQLGLWFLYEWDPGSATYHMPLVLRLRGELDRARLTAAIGMVIARHEGLRTRFVVTDGQPNQHIDPPPAQLDLPVTPLPASGWQELVAEQVRRPFWLLTEPGFRYWLGQLADDDHILLLNSHHIITDGWSVGILTRELAECYAGRAAALPPLQVQPVDYAAWQHAHRDQLHTGLAYWTEQLSDLPPLELPTDRPRPATPTGAGKALNFAIDPATATAVEALAAEHNLSPLAILLAALTTVLHRYTGQTDLPIGSIFSGRTHTELEPVIGYLANTLVLRTRLDAESSAIALLRQCHSTVVQAMQHQDVPFALLVDTLQPPRTVGENPLFQVALSLLPTAFDTDPHLGQLSAAPVALDTITTSRFDLSVQVTQYPDHTMTGWIEYSTELFDHWRIQALIGHFLNALAGLVADPEQAVAEVGLLSAQESGSLAGWNSSGVDFGTGNVLLQELVARWAEQAPDRVALRSGEVAVGFGELEVWANRLAWLLREEFGVGPEQVVGVLLERGVLIAQVELGVLKAGGAWLPLDPGHPAARLGFQVADAGVTVVVTESGLADRVPAGVARVVVDEPVVAARLAGYPASAPECPAVPDNAAYLIYTSGSTGAPKGVLVSHRAVVNFAGGVGALFSIGPGDRLLQFANPAFDVSVFDIFAALAHGATSVAAPRSVLHDVELLGELLVRERITVADIPPAVLGLLDPDSLPDLRALFVGLEAFPAELVNRWRTPDRQFHNGYGPTEATVACVDYRCPDQPLTGPPPIGRAMPNHRAYVLDPEGNLAPIGVAGQLHIAGAGLARGYRNRPALTAERFLPCPFGAPGERMYATGDIAAWSPDGQLHFLGRADRQVKIRGLRIELGEIEHALTSYPGISSAAAVVNSSEAGTPRLDAYLIATDAPVDTTALLGHLTRLLPLHMIPATYTTLDALPINANGKLDHTQLPPPTAPTDQPHQLPTTETEHLIAAIWQQLLNLPANTITKHDNYFQLGGSSLVVMQLISRIRREFGVELTVVEVFGVPVLCDLAAEVDRLAAEHALGEAELEGIDAQLDTMSDEEIDRLLAGRLDDGTRQDAPDLTSGGIE